MYSAFTTGTTTAATARRRAATIDSGSEISTPKTTARTVSHRCSRNAA